MTHYNSNYKKNQVVIKNGIAENALKALTLAGKNEVKSEAEAMQAMFNVVGVKPEELICDGEPKCFYKNSTQRYSGHEKPDGTKIINYGDWKEGTGKELDHTIIIKSDRPLSSAEQKQNMERIESKRKQREKEEEQKRQEGLKRLKGILNNSSSCHTSTAIKDNAYLKRKGFTPDQLKDTDLSCSKDGKIINIPLFSTIGGDPENIERIFENGDKRPIEGLKKAGLFTMIGNPDTDTYYLSESFFTGFTANLATGKTGVSCNGSSNIENVYLNLKKQRPDVNFILLADNDLKKEAEKGINKGRETAEELNNKYGLPYVLCPVNSDFNDYYEGFLNAGDTREQALNKVKEYILNPDNIIKTNKEEDGDTPEQRIEPKKNNSLKYSLPAGFYKEDGLIKFEAEKGKQQNVCSDLEVVAFTKNDKNEYGVYIVFDDITGLKKQCIIDRSLLSSQIETHKYFLARGIKSIYNPSLFRKLLENSNPSKCIQVSDKTGWNKDKTAYVFTDETLCKDEITEDIIYRYKFDSEYETGGTFQSWKDNVCKYSNDNPVLIFAFSMVFGGALSSYLDCAGIGSHFYGDSSAGKSTTAIMAASVLNGENSFQSWRVTNNGFEGVAAINNNSCLIFDDISEVTPDDLDKIVYMAINGNGKQRATKTGAAAELSKWQINLISTGEFSASDYLVTGGRKKQNAGQALRLLDLPAAEIGSNGCFDCKHEFEDFASFSDYLKAEATKHYGFAFKGFVREVLKQDKHELEKDMKETQDKLKEAIKEDFGGDIDNQTGRVIKSLSCVIIAGELATECKITTWNTGDAFKSCLKILKAWINFRGGFGNHEIKTALNALKEFIETKSSQHIEDTKDDLPFKGEKLAYFEDGFFYITDKQLKPLSEKINTTKATLKKVLQQLSGKDTTQQFRLKDKKTGLTRQNAKYWKFSLDNKNSN